MWHAVAAAHPQGIAQASQTGASGLEVALIGVLGAIAAAVISSVLSSRLGRRWRAEQDTDKANEQRIADLEKRIDEAEARVRDLRGEFNTFRASTVEWRADHSKATNEHADLIDQRISRLEGQR